ncbi:MAG TPA: class I SAM-dependent methyltransferase [Acidimicrobiales bacterium]|jgi:SAM-dependent methyltransferase|nr:class I SAM-dependent methyltransferase [Acidimicrobiales bacterium]
MSEAEPPFVIGGGGFDGERYQERFDDLARSGVDVHGEADFVVGYAPESVLDAGCGTGRVALELARRGIYVVAADRDESMLGVARRLGADLATAMPGVRLSFVNSDVADLALGGTFDVVLMAGNVPLFTPPGTQRQLVAGAAKHVTVGGTLVAGFQLDRGYDLETYDLHCAAAGLELADRFATWDRQAFSGGSYAVSVHHRP